MSCVPESLEVKFASLGGYILGKTLGKGYNSKVKLAYEPSTDQYYAVKIIKHSDADLNMLFLQKEIDILTQLKNPNIVNMIEFHKSVDYVKKNGSSYKVVAIVMELVSNGEVFDYVKITGRFSEEIARIYFRILIETLEHCHQQGIVHRDLKLENLLFDEKFNLKIADFGFATSTVGKGPNGQLRTYLGTESYMAPEIVQKKPYDGEAVDIFACGIILFIMISGIPPFLKADPRTDRYFKLLYKKDFSEFWDFHERHKAQDSDHNGMFYSEEFRDLMNAMLAYKPADRPSIEQIKAHPWFNGPLPNIKDLQNEFHERKEKVEAELLKQREEKKQEKLEKLQAEYDPEASYTGFRPYH